MNYFEYMAKNTARLSRYRLNCGCIVGGSRCIPHAADTMLSMVNTPEVNALAYKIRTYRAYAQATNKSHDKQ